MLVDLVYLKMKSMLSANTTCSELKLTETKQDTLLFCCYCLTSDIFYDHMGDGIKQSMRFYDSNRRITLFFPTD